MLIGIGNETKCYIIHWNGKKITQRKEVLLIVIITLIRIWPAIEIMKKLYEFVYTKCESIIFYFAESVCINLILYIFSLQAILQLKDIEEVLDPDIVNVKHIIHNMTQINKNGLVTNVDKKG
jgi:hypothetical protein